MKPRLFRFAAPVDDPSVGFTRSAVGPRTVKVLSEARFEYPVAAVVFHVLAAKWTVIRPVGSPPVRKKRYLPFWSGITEAIVGIVAPAALLSANSLPLIEFVSSTPPTVGANVTSMYGPWFVGVNVVLESAAFVGTNDQFPSVKSMVTLFGSVKVPRIL